MPRRGIASLRVCAQVTLHPFAESGIDSCGTFHVPNNRRSAGECGPILLAGIEVARSSDGSNEATVLGPIAFVSRAGAVDCTPLGIVNLERLDQPPSGSCDARAPHSTQC